MKRHRLLNLIIENTIIQFTLTLFICTAFFAGMKIAEKIEYKETYYLLNNYGQAVIGNGITERLTGKSNKIDFPTSVFEFPENCNLVKTKKEYDILSTNNKSIHQKINPDYPLFTGEGAYLYLFDKNFILLKDDFSKIPSTPDTYLNNGIVFNQKKQSEKNIKIVLVKLPNGLYISSQKLILLDGDKKKIIESNSMIHFKRNGIIYGTLKDKDIEVYETSVATSTAIIKYGNKSISYDALYDKLNSKAKSKEKKEQQLDVYSSTDDLYQYFLGNRYVYSGNKTFYRTEEGYVMQNGDNRFTLTSAPLYYEGEKKILLPSDYVVITPKLFQMNKMPAMTELTYHRGVIYTNCGKVSNTMKDIVLFDGEDTYLFFNKTKITWAKKKVYLSPCSSITVSKDGSIEIYDYKRDKFLFYQVDGYHDICAAIGKNITFNLGQDILNRPDGQEQILFSKPELLNIVE